ncbi:MAG TPA: DsrE/DsrF/DrsH-like family protein [Actinomycetota bacterium]|nr:DsrE/DsrF/DrsH-like family protein [Actinomycetota bacterium]
MVQTSRDATNDGAAGTDTEAIRELIDQALAERDAADGFNRKNKITIVAWDGHLDRVWPTLILSTTAAASGMQVSVFFTFWGLFALVKPERRRKTGKDWMTKALGQMNPGSTAKAKLSRYNFAGMGPWMLGKVAEDYKTPHPTELLELARDMGVRLIPCQMTMDLMGIGTEDLIDGLEEPIGAATALLEMKESAIQLFI